MAMAKEEEQCIALRQVLKERCPDAWFTDDDINKLVDEGFVTAASLALATMDDLTTVLPGRRGVVLILLKAFSQALEPSHTEDYSRNWIECMSIKKPALPHNRADVTRILFPDVLRKLPVTKQVYRQFQFQEPFFAANKYLEEADGTLLPILVSHALLYNFSTRTSEMNMTLFIAVHLKTLFDAFTQLSPHKLRHTLSFNCNEKTGASYSNVIVDKLRPDTLCVAYGRTLLVGEDKVMNLQEGEQDLRLKVKTLPPIHYGELKFILGYVASGSKFQWVYVGKNGGEDILPIRPCLDLNIFEDRCKYLLSVGYAYHMLCSMVDAMPEVQIGHSLFSKDVHGDRTILFLPDSIRKSVMNFKRNCALVKTTIAAVRRAYEVAVGCPYLPQRIKDTLKRSGMYIVDYKPIGYSFLVMYEKDLKNVARCVCQALQVLHKHGLVHRDIRLANIVQISQHDFMLIDLEAVAKCPNTVGTLLLRDWTTDTLDDGVYTELSDMHQLGQLLSSMMGCIFTENGRAFIQQLLSKKLSAELALNDIWFSNPKH